MSATSWSARLDTDVEKSSKTTTRETKTGFKKSQSNQEGEALLWRRFSGGFTSSNSKNINVNKISQSSILGALSVDQK
jgi:hypothetical protein